ncbi:hypothetical protein G7K_5113-t1 [Saitoella complicata NRRL Y-17804]|uniref:Uncharacterized protein n=2 Tax=Saitoella complicata (strain BCRC 22490 / CBS 7301 / JCM 7358 / NBRC 10748 / NRRL Y-17804) TaxID=698492 RepID=A0A0E9NNK3_SAICN|nr:hypothetical protein G7K_5113-t1 [Saitoella complicata NRRL Y-17804]
MSQSTPHCTADLTALTSRVNASAHRSVRFARVKVDAEALFIRSNQLQLISSIGNMITLTVLLVALVVTAVAYTPIRYLYDPLRLRRFPGPFLAAISPFWLTYHARRAQRYLAVDAAHKKCGKFVRISPNQVSINDPDAIQIVYGHQTGFLKSEFYDAFVSIHRGLFNTRDRGEHTRKRKIISHTFSQQAILGFEPLINKSLSLLLSRLSDMIDPATNSLTLDFLPWANYLAFDIIGDLAFGEPFHFIESGSDSNGAIRVLNDRGEWSATVGTIPWVRDWARYFLFDRFWVRGYESVQQLAKIAVTAVDRRLQKSEEELENRRDLLSFLLKATDEEGEPLPRSEVNAEALTQLIAGSDTTSNTLTHIIDLLCRNPECKTEIQAELDEAFPEITDDLALEWKDVKDLKYTAAVLDEVLRYRPTSALGLPRIVPPQGAEVCGVFFEGGTVLSVPSYSVHHDPNLWESPEEFRPERWLDISKASVEKYFIPFSYGPRSCVGRNVAVMELIKSMASILRRFDFERVYPNEETVLREGFLLKPTELWVTMSKRA